jgi:hypothetical protein
MAKMKGTFGFSAKVSSGNSAGFSNVPGAGNYTVTVGKQFLSGWNKEKKKKPEVGKPQSQQEDTVINDPVKDTVKPPAVKERETIEKVSGAKLGGFKVNPGTGQVKTTSKKITLADIEDPNSKTKNPIKPENIPDSYKPSGDAPSSRQWSEADKAALESERPRSYVPPDFKAEPDSPEAGAARLKALDAEVGAAAKAKRVKKATSSNTPPNQGQQFSSTSTQPPVDLRGM